jgi:hypothetical protein
MRFFSIDKSYGRGGGVIRGRGVGVHRPEHGVSVGVGVDVGGGDNVAVGVGLEVLVGVAVVVAVAVGVAVGVAVVIGVGRCIRPPHTIISSPVQTAVCWNRAAGAL